MSSNDARGQLTRRFTTNALPTLSPIGQQRRQAAGDTQMVSPDYVTRLHEEHKAGKEDGEMVLAGGREGDGYLLGGLQDLLADSEPSPGPTKRHGITIMVNGVPIGTPHRRGKSLWGAIGDGRPRSSVGVGKPARRRGGSSIFAVDDAIGLLTPHAKTSGAYARIAPVSPLIFLHQCCWRCWSSTSPWPHTCRGTASLRITPRRCRLFSCTCDFPFWIISMRSAGALQGSCCLVATCQKFT